MNDCLTQLKAMPTFGMTTIAHVSKHPQINFNKFALLNTDPITSVVKLFSDICTYMIYVVNI